MILDEVQKCASASNGSRALLPADVPPDSLHALTETIRRLEPEGVDQLCAETGYTLEDGRSLWRASYMFLSNVNILAQYHRNQLEAETDFYRKFSCGTSICSVPWGRTLICLPSNAAVPLACILPLSFVISGNMVTVAMPEKVRGSGELLLRALTEIYPSQVSVWHGRTRDAVATLAGKGECDLLYFLGSSAHYASITSMCASVGVDLVYEGEGNSILYLEKGCDSVALQNAAAILVESKRFCHGQMCSAPNVVAVHVGNAEQFTQLFSEASSRVSLHSPIRKLCSDATWEYANHFPADIAHAMPKSGDPGACYHPILVPCNDLTYCVGHEVFCPLVFLYTYHDDSASAVLTPMPHRLQRTAVVTTFGPHNRSRIVRDVARCCINTNPVVQHPCLPWGCYGKSGASVLTDFVAKGFRRVLVETPNE